MTMPVTRRAIWALMFAAALARMAGDRPGLAASQPLSISGRVLAAATGQPIAGARVITHQSDAILSAISAADGSFQFANLSPGRYTLRASAAGYLSQPFTDDPALGLTLIAVRAGQPVARHDLRMRRGGTIAGRVLDDRGEPVVKAPVHAIAHGWFPEMSSFGQAQAAVSRARTETDDRGEFRLIALDAADYSVAVMDRASATFAPSTPDIRQASRTTVRGNEEHVNVNIRISSAASGSIEGTVTAAAGFDPRLTSLRVELWPAGGAPPSTTSQTMSSAGRFRFDDVAPGRYELVIRPGATPQQPRFWARQPIVVKPGAPTATSVALQPGARISGRFTAVRMPFWAVTILPIGSDQPATSMMRASASAVDGAFSIAGIAPGRYRWESRLGSPSPVPEGSVVSVYVKDEDVTDLPLTIAADSAIDNVRVEVTAPSGIRGSVTGRDGNPTTAGIVVAIATDRKYWTTVSRRLRAERADTAGEFEFASVPPGPYVVAHLERLGPGQLWDAAFLKTVSGTPVTVPPGGWAAVQLRLK